MSMHMGSHRDTTQTSLTHTLLGLTQGEGSAAAWEGHCSDG